MFPFCCNQIRYNSKIIFMILVSIWYRWCESFKNPFCINLKVWPKWFKNPRDQDSFLHFLYNVIFLFSERWFFKRAAGRWCLLDIKMSCACAAFDPGFDRSKTKKRWNGKHCEQIFPIYSRLFTIMLYYFRKIFVTGLPWLVK